MTVAINSEKARKVAQVFESLARAGVGEQVLMDACTVRRADPCGTIACHAGWYALHKFREDSVWSEFEDDMKALVRRGYFVSWFDGASAMAGDLGFDNVGSLTLWADMNPDLWGNDFGRHMFASAMAFGNTPVEDNETTLSHIAEHWRSVADRLERQERLDAS